MKVLCRHGHFAFYPRRSDDITRYVNHYRIELEAEQDYYTFPTLIGAPDFSLLGLNYINLVAKETIEGSPWEVMKENGFVYHIQSGVIVPKQSVSIVISPPQTGFYYLSQTPLIQPGSVLGLGNRIMSYDGEFNMGTMQFKLRSFSDE